jgi:hypothetical protein
MLAGPAVSIAPELTSAWAATVWLHVQIPSAKVSWTAETNLQELYLHRSEHIMVVHCKVSDWEASKAVSFPSGESIPEDGKEADQEASCRAASRAFERMTGYQLTERMKASIAYACSCITNSGTGQPSNVLHYYGLELGNYDYEKIRCFTPGSAQLRRDTKVRMNASTDARVALS